MLLIPRLLLPDFSHTYFSTCLYVFRCDQFHSAWLLDIPDGISAGMQLTPQPDVTKVTFPYHFGYSDTGYDGLLYPDI